MPNKSDSTNTTKKGSFFSNMMTELKKVVWPSGAQTAKSTATTIAFVLLVALILVGLNAIFQQVNQAYWNLF